MKQKVVELLVLALPNFNKVFQVECDASGSAIGAILNQEGKLIALFSEKFSDAKRKNFVYDQGFYAIVKALKKWRHYLIPKDFVLYTDHKALQYLGSQHNLNQRHMKWVEYLQSFTFVIKHKSGVTNRVAHALSRRRSLLTEIKVEVLGFDEMKELYDADPDFSEAWRECRTPNLTDHISKYDEYFIQEGMLLKGIQLCIPRSSMRLNLIKEKHSGGLARHFGIDKTLSLLK